MPEKRLNSGTMLVNGRHGDAKVDLNSRSIKVTSHRKHEGRDEALGRRLPRSLVARVSTAAASAAAWRRPAGSTSESASTADDSGFASTGLQARPTAASPTSDAYCSSSTTAMSSSPVDWLDVERVRVPGAVGITNHHNTCFINAVVQCLSNTPALVIHALDTLHHDQVSSIMSKKAQSVRSRLAKGGELGKELSKLLRAIWTGRCSADSSAAFHRAVRRLASGWYGGEEQNDALEFAAWMLNRLRDEQFGARDVDGCPRSRAVSSNKQTVYDLYDRILIPT